MEAAKRLLTGAAPYVIAAAAAAAGLQQLGAMPCESAAAGVVEEGLCEAQSILYGSVVLDVTLAPLLIAGLLAAILLVNHIRTAGKHSVFVVDFDVFRAPASWNFSRADIKRYALEHGDIHPDDIELLSKLVFRSGLGDETAVPPKPLQVAVFGDKAAGLGPHKPGIEMAREEFESTCFQCTDRLLEKTGVDPKKIKFVITNSSLFNTTPSLSAAIINRYKMKDDTINYSLGGMGCSAGVVALDLARDLLQRHPGSYALVVSHENIANNYYTGREKSMLIANTLFRSNGAAILLSSRPQDARSSKYTVRHIVRTIMAADDEAYRCVWQTEDDQRIIGVALKKELIGVAGRAVMRNMGRLGPLVLPISEQIKYGANAAVRAAVKALPPKTANKLPASWTKPYTPDFSKAFDAVCIHTGGRGVIDSMEQNLGMSKEMVEASRAALFQFGNTSSCSVWYELAYSESFNGLRGGARVWQIAFGSGFKCNSAVLVANRAIKEVHPAWDGFDKSKMYAQLAEIDKEVAASRARRAAEKAAQAQAAQEHAAATAEAVAASS